MSTCLWSRGFQYSRVFCPPLSPRLCSKSCPLSRLLLGSAFRKKSCKEVREIELGSGELGCKVIVTKPTAYLWLPLAWAGPSGTSWIKAGDGVFVSPMGQSLDIGAPGRAAWSRQQGLEKESAMGDPGCSATQTPVDWWLGCSQLAFSCHWFIQPLSGKGAERRPACLQFHLSNMDFLGAFRGPVEDERWIRRGP